MKTAVLSLLLIAAVAAVCVQGAQYRNQTRTEGYFRRGDRLLDRAVAMKVARRGQAQVYNYNYPSRGKAGMISYYIVLDKWANGTNGDIYSVYGGIRQRYLKLSIRSKVGQGFHYVIDVYGR